MYTIMNYTIFSQFLFISLIGVFLIKRIRENGKDYHLLKCNSLLRSVEKDKFWVLFAIFISICFTKIMETNRNNENDLWYLFLSIILLIVLWSHTIYTCCGIRSSLIVSSIVVLLTINLLVISVKNFVSSFWLIPIFIWNLFLFYVSFKLTYQES